MTSPQPEPAAQQAPAFKPGALISYPGSKLAAALAAFQTELPHVEAKETGDAGSYQYRYAGLGSVSKKILPLLGKHGLSFTSAPTLTDAGKFVLRYRLLHESGEEINGEYPLSGGNAQAQGSMITYARRYSLLAVTGVSPDQDDDDAAATQQKATEFPTEPTELDSAKQRVLAAWNFQFGDFVQAEAEKHYRAWSKGGALTSADAAELRRYAGYLSNLPKEDAGAEPTTASSEAPKIITPRQRGKLFALMGEIGLHDKGAQLTWINNTLKTDYGSRSLITFDDANVLIKGLEQGIEAPPEGGEPA